MSFFAEIQEDVQKVEDNFKPKVDEALEKIKAVIKREAKTTKRYMTISPHMVYSYQYQEFGGSMEAVNRALEILKKEGFRIEHYCDYFQGKEIKRIKVSW